MGGINLKRILHIILLLCVLILAILSIYGFSRLYIDSEEVCNTVKNDYNKNSEYFEEIATLLLKYNDVGIRISNDKSNNWGGTEKEVNEIVLQSYEWKYINKLGYNLITKPYDGGVYFYRFRQIGVGRGIMYYPNDFQPEHNRLIVECVPITDDGWYYFTETSK